MQIIDEIIELLSDDGSSLQSALLKSQVLAHRLGNEELRVWVDNELRGYPEVATVPPYRSLNLTIMGHITNGVYHYRNQVLAIQHLKEPLRTNITRKEIRDSIGVISDWKGKDDVVITIPTEVCSLLSKPLSETYFVQQAWGKPSAGAFEQVLVQVRSRLLEFCLQISDKLPADLPMQKMRARAEEVSSNEIFRNAVFGDNATIVVGSGTISDVKNKVQRNDFESLRGFLEAEGVSNDDIAELHTAIQSDAAVGSPAQRSIGPKVGAWIAHMMAKAGGAAWNISVSAAGTLLGAALSAYYGLGT